MKVITGSILLTVSFAHLLGAFAETQQIVLTEGLKIPGSVLTAGKYTFSVEDRLSDRAVIKITSGQGRHEYILAVPASDSSSAEGLILFPQSPDNRQVLRAWKCPGCQRPLRVVYPKDEAVAITEAAAQPVLAVDPASDKLPTNLSADDRRVVTLWLLSPKEVTPDGQGKGVLAAKYMTSTESPSSSLASNQTANASQGRKMPRTASHTFEFAIAGLLLLGAGLGSKLQRGVSQDSARRV